MSFIGCDNYATTAKKIEESAVGAIPESNLPDDVICNVLMGMFEDENIEATVTIDRKNGYPVLSVILYPDLNKNNIFKNHSTWDRQDKQTIKTALKWEKKIEDAKELNSNVIRKYAKEQGIIDTMLIYSSVDENFLYLVLENESVEFDIFD